VDACRSGWIAIKFTGGCVEVDLRDEFSEIHEGVNDDGTVLVDIPIGLPDEGRRGCDEDAKDLLGCRGNSVFYAPTRKSVFEFGENEYEAANQESKERTGNGISRQAWNIIPKIKEVNAFVEDHDGSEVRETHPEVCFYGLDGRPMAYSKKDERGEERRRQVLEEYEAELGFCVNEVMEEATEMNGVSNDDALDALVAAVVTCLGNEKRYESLGDSDKKGDKEIVYVEDVRD